jgi:DNA segregation ATPase FtsK/SpoIIIE, S-DNA-T family
MMQTIELIGQVAADFLKRSIQTDETNEGVARFLLNRLTAQQVAAVSQTILQNSAHQNSGPTRSCGRLRLT